MATKIKLMRLGKMREPHYRIVVADARTKRDGRSIETIGEYHPKNDPSIIRVDSERAAYWLGVGAQPTEAVAAILKVTGDWQRFKGLPAPEPMKVAAAEAGQAGGLQRRAGRGRRAEPEAPRRPRRASGRAKKAEPAAETGASRAAAADGRRRADVLEEALEHLVRGIVDHPDDVRST